MPGREGSTVAPAENTLPLSMIEVGVRHRREMGDLQSLAASIQSVGLLHPVVITADHRLIAGARRLEAVKRLGWREVPVTVVRLDRLILGERDENAQRLDLTPSEAVALAEAIRPLEQEAARARQASAGPATGKGRKRSGSGKKSEAVGQSRDKVAASVGLSASTLTKAEAVVRAAQRNPREFGAVQDEMDRTGNVTKAYHKVQQAERKTERQTQIWPEGRYGVILADPPWRPDVGLLDPSRQIENQYPTMTSAELEALAPQIQRLALRDCVLVMWTTAQKIGEAAALIAVWGFTIKSGAVWVKPSVGMGYWFRQRHELLILATRGMPATPADADRPDSVIESPRGRHSAKPGIVYELLDRMFPGVPKVELFSRGPRPGFAAWGNEGVA